jgi:large subunit ribosomal protein L10
VEVTLRAPRPDKVAVVDEVQARLESSAGALLTEYRGLAVKDIETLRRALRTAGGEYKVYKNTLVRRAAKDTGLDVIEPMLEGPTAIAFVHGDVAAVAKVLRDFARTNPSLVVKGGLIGSSLLDARSASALAELPSREVLLAQIAGALAAPMQKFAGLLAAVPQKFAYGLSALIDSRGGADAVAAAAAEAAPAEQAAAPAEAAAVDAAPTDTAPADTAPTDTAPTDTAPTEESAPASTAGEAEAPEAAAEDTAVAQASADEAPAEAEPAE